MMTDKKQRCLSKVKGPVFPIPTPFTETGAVDYASLASYVDWLVRQGARTIMVTVGTSRFSLLSRDEMRKVNETVTEAVGGRAYTIVTGPHTGSLDDAVEFARHAASIKADAILGVYPERFYSEHAVYDFFKDFSEAADIGVMIHLAPMKAGTVTTPNPCQYPLELVRRIAALPNMVGMKEESNAPQLIYAYNRALKDRFCVIGGAGCMRTYLTASTWEQPAYLVGIGNFTPRTELDFYTAVQAGDMDKARRIVDEKEKPFFDEAIRMGWHLALKEAMAACGLMPAWERKPLARLGETDQTKIQKIIGEWL
ncbi:MAG: dihydrodipicolinate synthase family protein [Desulfovibrionaceae bacterium]|nr:dihydrodipicolinate synthase family protein [Desulfovibrionaceae bacterium]